MLFLLTFTIYSLDYILLIWRPLLKNKTFCTIDIKNASETEDFNQAQNARDLVDIDFPDLKYYDSDDYFRQF